MSATCSRGHELADGHLNCPTCLWELNRRAVRAHQGQFLVTASTRPDGYLLTRRAARGVVHLQQFGVDFTFCDERVMGAWKPGRIEWDFRGRSSVCSACLEAVSEILTDYTGGPVPVDLIASSAV